MFDEGAAYQCFVSTELPDCRLAVGPPLGSPRRMTVVTAYQTKPTNANMDIPMTAKSEPENTLNSPHW